MSNDVEHRFGFTWGPMDVHRIMHLPGKGRLLSVKTEHGYVEVWVSDKGRRLRVWRDGKELS